MQRLRHLNTKWRAALCVFAGTLIVAVIAAPVMAAWAYPVGPSNSLWLLGERFGAGTPNQRNADGPSRGEGQRADAADLVVPTGDFPRANLATEVAKAAPGTETVAAKRSDSSGRPAANPRWSRPSGRIPYTAGDVDMLAHLIQAEAGGEPYAGQVAVAAVVINRILSGKFPSSVYGVIFEQDAFEPVSNGTFWNPPTDTAYKAAYAALGGWDPSGGALFFFAPAKTDHPFMWSRPQTLWIGDHAFAR